MDIIAAILLYVMPELNSFVTFNMLLNEHIPLYFISENNISHSNIKQTSLIGAYVGCHLAQQILKIYDQELYNYLNNKMSPAKLWAFPIIQSFQGLTQPFHELLKLWDFLVCFGFQLNVILCIGHLIVRKKDILSLNIKDALQSILAQRTWMNHNVNAEAVIDATLDIISTLNKKNDKETKKLWNQILKHGFDMETAMQIQKEMNESELQNEHELSKNNHNKNKQILTTPPIKNKNKEIINYNNQNSNNDSNKIKDDDITLTVLKGPFLPPSKTTSIAESDSLNDD